MLNFAQIPGWTWIFVAMALVLGSILITGVVVERRRNRSFKMVKRSSVYKRQVICKRALVAGLTISLIVALVGCASGGGITVEDSESSGFLPSVAPEETTKAVESEGIEPAAEEAEGVSQILRTLDMKDADIKSLCDQLFGSERELEWANTSFLSRTKTRILTSGFNDALGFPLYMDHDWLNGEYYQSQLEKGKEREILDLDYLGTDEAKDKQEELKERKASELSAFQMLATKEKGEYCEEKVTQENWENMIFTIMLIDFFNDQEVFQVNNGEYMKEVQEFLDDIYDPESEDSMGRTGLARLVEFEKDYEPTGTYEDAEHLVPNIEALRLKAFAQQLFEQDQDSSGLIMTRTTKAFWTIEGRVDNDNFVRATKNDKPEDQYTGRFYVRNFRGKNGKVLFQYGINREDMRLAIFAPVAASSPSGPTSTPTPVVTKEVTVIYQHRYWGPASNGAYPFPDVTVKKLLGDDYSYEAPALSGYKFHNGFSGVRGTITPGTPDPLVFTFYYEAPSSSKSSGGGGGSKWKPDPKPDLKPDPVPENPTPKPDGEGGKTPTASGGGPGVIPNDTGYGANQKQENGAGETANISEKVAGTEDGKTQQERQEETAAKNEQLAEEVKDQGGNPNSSNPNDGSHTDGGNVPDTSQSITGNYESKSETTSISTTVDNGDGTTTTTTTNGPDTGSMQSNGSVSRDGDDTTVSSPASKEAASATSYSGSNDQGSVSSEASESSNNSSNQSSGSQRSSSNDASSGSSSSSANNSSSSTSGASSGGGGSSVSSSSGGGSNAASSSGSNDKSSTTAEVSTSDGIVSRD